MSSTLRSQGVEAKEEIVSMVGMKVARSVRRTLGSVPGLLGLVGLGVGLSALGVNFVASKGGAVAVSVAVVGGVLVAASSLAALSRSFKPNKAKCAVDEQARVRLRIVTATTVATALILTGVMFSMMASDHLWWSQSGCTQLNTDSCRRCPASSPSAKSASWAAATSTPERSFGIKAGAASISSGSVGDAASETTDTTAGTPPSVGTSGTSDGADPSGSSSASAAIDEKFGFNRDERTHSVPVVPVAPTDASKLDLQDFVVLPRQGDAGSPIAKLDDPIVQLGNGQTLLTVRFDLGCQSQWMGGTVAVTIVYKGAIPLRVREWRFNVSSQSRLVLYGLAVIPWTMILAMYAVFDMWPTELKQWWANVVAIGASTVAAYAAAGLRNPSWRSSVFADAAIVAATYGAAIASSQLLKQGGHGTQVQAPDPAQQA